MRRMLRLLLRAIAVACVALAIVAGAFWPISYRHIDVVLLRITPTHAVAAGARQGRVMAGFVGMTPGRWVEVERIDLGPPDLDPRDPPGAWRGFYAELGPAWYVMLPTPAAILLLLAIAALAWPVARRLVPPPDPTRCRACGYDLRATPDRCPECGATDGRPR